MKNLYRMRSRRVLLSSACLTAALLCSNAATAQADIPTGTRDDRVTTPVAADDRLLASADDSGESTKDIVVTGTQIRGIAPAGTNSVNLNRNAIVATGASTAMQALAAVPQVSNAFNAVPTIPAFGVARAIVRPSIRNIGNGSGGSSTLVLVDGHRAVPAGTLESSPDVDVIPAGVLERVDIVPDGGSSIYGSDAVGGVINFITRRRFNGIEASSHLGFANDYRSFDMNLTVGKDWGSGSAYLSYFYIKQDAVLGKDRDYVRQVSASGGGCAPGTVTVTRAGAPTTYALPGRVPGTGSTCDFTDNFSIFPAAKRHSAFGSLTQTVTEGVDVDLKGFYTRRKTTSYNDLNQAGDTFATAPQTGTITAANPYYVPIAPDPGVQSVAFSYAGVFDNRGLIDLEEYGGTATITAAVGNGWQIRALGNYGQSHTDASTPAIDTAAQAAALAGTTTRTALNPYDIAASSPAVLASINRRLVSQARQELLNARIILDGTLFPLPGGDVRTAVGVEWVRQEYSIIQGNRASGLLSLQSALGASGSRTVKSAFAEISIPFVSSMNSFCGARSLALNLSGRYDDYSDFGDTFNPKVGVTYQPVKWISIRGNYGKSFNAPGLADSAGIASAQLLNVSPFRAIGDAFIPSGLRPTIILAGSNPDLRPQTADTWSAGIDIDVPSASGLRISATYYHILMKDIIGTIPFFSPVAFTPAYAAFITRNPTLAQSLSASAGFTTTGSYPNVESLYATSGTPYVLMDARQKNLGQLKQNGVDFNVTYRHDTAFGSFNAGLAGTYTLNRDSAAVSGQPFVDQLRFPGTSDLSLSASIGAEAGNVTGNIRLNHSAGYGISPALATGLGTQSHVGSFTTVDLYLSVDAGGEGALRGTILMLNIGNVFDQDPPFFNQDNGYTNGSTLGRSLQIGIRKAF